MKQKKPIFTWNEETGIATCILKGSNRSFVGNAMCHPDDMDMMSEKVGCEIAYNRAIIKALKYEKDCVLKPQIQALKQTYYSMKHSKKFNPKSYENIMLQRQIQNKELDLEAINNMIACERNYLNQYIETKENFYKSIRKQRAGGQN